jgi:hypothetical protein
MLENKQAPSTLDRRIGAFAAALQQNKVFGKRTARRTGLRQQGIRRASWKEARRL